MLKYKHKGKDLAVRLFLFQNYWKVKENPKSNHMRSPADISFPIQFKIRIHIHKYIPILVYPYTNPTLRTHP